MKKRILVVYYSQSGQLLEILNKLIRPIQDTSEIDFLQIEPVKAFPFPWTNKAFFAAMPGSVLEHTIPIKQPEKNYQDYDLVILGYQVWFLSPSIPVNSFLESDWGKSLLKNKKVITVIGGRNMWVMAQQRVSEKLKAINTNLVGNITFMDLTPNLISVVTIAYWMFSGVKNRFLGFFPIPGVQPKEIERSESFGGEIQKCLEVNEWRFLQEKLVRKKAVSLKHDVIVMETNAKRIFKIWANAIVSISSEDTIWRTFLLLLFEIYLAFVIFCISPIVSILSTFGRSFNKEVIKKKMTKYSEVN